MSDASPAEPNQASPTGDATHPQEPVKKGGGALRIILIVMLLIMVGLLALDLRNKSASNQAFEKVQEWVDGRKKASPAEVQELIGRQPNTEIVQKDHYYEETYSWRRGRLFDTYYVTVVYAEENDKPVLHEVEKNKAPEGNSIPNPSPPDLDESRLNPDYVEGGEFSGEGSDEAVPADGEAPSADGDESGDGEEPSDGEDEPADTTPEPADGDAAADGEEAPTATGDE